MLRIIIRILSAVIAIGGVAWFFADKGYESALTCIGGVIGVLGTFVVEPRQENSRIPPIDQPVREDFCAGFDDSTDFFMDRFASAFPGVRGVEWFDNPQDCIRRIGVILAKPLSFPYEPIWWWRGYSNLQITSFRHVVARKIIMNHLELVIDKIAAINLQHPSRVFLYIQTRADKPCGVYKHTRESRKRMIENHGYAWEEMGFYDGTYISRSELDDGVACINGVTVELNRKAEVRTRFLSPYNLVIAAQGSAINRTSFDSEFKGLMNGILSGTATVEDLANALNQLPKLQPRRTSKQ